MALAGTFLWAGAYIGALLLGYAFFQLLALVIDWSFGGTP